MALKRTPWQTSLRGGHLTMTSAYNYNRLLSAYPLLGTYFYPDRAISAYA